MNEENSKVLHFITLFGSKDNMNSIDVALICKALSDVNRLQIVQLLTQGERCTCHLLEHFKVTQPTLTHHMKILAECDLLQSKKEGRWTFYSLNYGTLSAFREFIAGLDRGKNSDGDKTDCCE